MNVRAAVKAAWIVGILGVVLGLVLTIINAADRSWDGALLLATVVTSEAAFLTVGALILTRQPGNRIGALLLIGGLTFTAAVACIGWAERALIVDPGSLPFGPAAAWFSRLLTPPAFGLFIPIFLLFPDGRPPSRRWRIVWWTWLVAVAVAALGWVTGLPDIEFIGFFDARATVSNPTFVGTWAEQVTGFAGFVLFGSALATGVGVVMRYRRVRGLERQQIRWLAFVAVSVLGIFFSTLIYSAVTGSDLEGPIGEGVFLLFAATLLVGLPLTIGIAILKYRLYDLDLVIRKAVIATVLTLFVALAYVAIVAGLGSLAGDAIAPRIAATATVAVAFQPVRSRATRFANRLVYGHRATPYEVLARFSDRIGGTYEADTVLPRLARVIAEGTSAASAEVWLLTGGTLTRAAAWPEGAAATLDGGLAEDGSISIAGRDRAAPVIHQGQTLGAISITKPPGEPITVQETELVDRLADQAGLVVANVGLTADLEAKLADIARQAAELRASAQRIVAAQDEERRRLERNIHDGAQQHLVALAVKIRLARSMLAKDPDRGAAMLGDLRELVDAAVETLRALALGVYPPLLEEQGIAPALAAQYTRGGLPVSMRSDGLGRYPVEIEAAVYFCVLEALQNAAKHAEAGAIEIALEDDGRGIAFRVSDDGRGFAQDADRDGTGLAGMRDRVAVFGGDVQIDSAPGGGTIVRGRIPATQGVSA